MGIFKKFKNNFKPKAVVVGLDGVPFSLLANLKQSGRIPKMSAIFDKGYFGQMRVSIPEISSVSWSSFMTGKQSGEHGIYGFIDLEAGTYNMFFPNYSNLKAMPLWDELARSGKKSVVINMPATYPAGEINGAMISGFVAIDINKAVYPPALIPKLNDLGYRIDIDTAKARHDPELLFSDLDATLAGRQRAVDLLWQEVDWDLFIVVITGTDRLMHFLWTACEQEDHPYHQPFLDYFTKLDDLIGQIYDRFMNADSSDTDLKKFYMLSDHGFCKIDNEVYLNRWLQENGYLRFQKNAPETIMDIGSGSRVFALDPSRLHINLKSKYSDGSVASSDYDRLCRELKTGLEALRSDSGDPVVKKVYFKDELFHGPHLSAAPDLVVLSNRGYDLKGKVNSAEVFGRTDLQGMHTQDDAFFYSSTGAKLESIFEAKEIIIRSF